MDDRNSLSPDSGYPVYYERKASFVCKTFMGTNGLSRKKLAGSDTDLSTKSSLLEDDDVFDETDGPISPQKFHPKPILRHNRTQIFSANDLAATLPANVKNPFADPKSKRKSVFVFPTFRKNSHSVDDLALERGKPKAKENFGETTNRDDKQGEPPFTKTKKKLTPVNSIDISGPMSTAPPPPTPPPLSDVVTKRAQKRARFKRGKNKVIKRKSMHDLDIPRLPEEASFYP